MLRAYKQVSSIYSQLGDSRQALYYNEAAIKRYPSRAELFLDQGKIYQNSNRLDSALFSFRKAVEIDSSLVMAHYLIGTIYMKWKSYSGLPLAAFEEVLNTRKIFP